MVDGNGHEFNSVRVAGNLACRRAFQPASRLAPMSRCSGRGADTRVQRRHSCRRRRVGHASACPVERNSTGISPASCPPAWKRRSPRNSSCIEKGGLLGLWPFVGQPILAAGVLSDRLLDMRRIFGLPCAAGTRHEAGETPSCAGRPAHGEGAADMSVGAADTSVRATSEATACGANGQSRGRAGKPACTVKIACHTSVLDAGTLTESPVGE